MRNVLVAALLMTLAGLVGCGKEEPATPVPAAPAVISPEPVTIAPPPEPATVTTPPMDATRPVDASTSSEIAPDDSAAEEPVPPAMPDVSAPAPAPAVSDDPSNQRKIEVPPGK